MPPSVTGDNVPVKSNNNPPLNQKQSEPLASQELGDIIVRSLETVTEALSDDVPVDEKQIENAVTKGINKSIIAKQKGGQGGAQSGSKADQAMADYWNQKKYIDYKKEQERQAKLEDESRKRRDTEWDKKADQFFSALNAASHNPLKGFSDALDKGVKGLFSGVGKLMNKDFAEVGQDLKKGAKKVWEPFKAVGTVGGGILKGVGKGLITTAAIGSLVAGKLSAGGQSKSALSEVTGTIEESKDETQKKGKLVQPQKGNLIGLPAPVESEVQPSMLALPSPEDLDNKSENKPSEKEQSEDEEVSQPKKGNVVEPAEKNNALEKAVEKQQNEDSLQSLVEDNDEKEQAADEDRNESNKNLGKLVEQGEFMKNFQMIKIGALVTGVAALGLIIPQIAGKVGPILNNIPVHLQDLKTKVGLLFNGPNSIFHQISRAIKASLAKLADIEGDDLISKALRGFGEKFAYGASEELIQARTDKKNEIFDIANSLGGVSQEEIKNALDNNQYSKLSADGIFSTFSQGEDDEFNLDDYFLEEGQSDSKSEYYNKYQNKQLADFDKSDMMWFKVRLPPEKYAKLEQGYALAMASKELEDINLQIDNDKSTRIDYNKMAEEDEKAAKEKELSLNAETRIANYKAGKVSRTDLLTDKQWIENPELVKFMAESGPDFWNNLKANSKFETLTEDGMEALDALKKTIGDFAKDMVGRENSWQNSNQFQELLQKLKENTQVTVSYTENKGVGLDPLTRTSQ